MNAKNGFNRVMKIGNRIRTLRKAKKMTILELATAIGSDVGNVSRLERDKQGYTEATLTKIADALGVKVVDLFSEEVVEPPTKQHTNKSDSYRVDVLNISASAGKGVALKDEFIETIKSIEYSSSEARLLFGNRPQEHIKLIAVNGDSMSGTFEPRDQIFVDVSINYFDGDGIYIFVLDNDLYVKRLQLQHKRLAVISDNKKYETWYIDQYTEANLNIVSKVLISQSRAYKIHG